MNFLQPLRAFLTPFALWIAAVAAFGAAVIFCLVYYRCDFQPPSGGLIFGGGRYSWVG